jgi:hypothetical protein
LREVWPVADGSWRHTGAEELPCELVSRIFLGSGVLVKQLRSWRKEMGVRERERERGRERDEVGKLGEQGQCLECTPI